MRFTRKVLRIAPAVVGIVCLGLVSFLLIRPVYRKARERTAIEQAAKFMAAGEHKKASLRARTALSFNPANLEACSIMARLAELSKSPHLLDWRKRIAELAPSAENQLFLASAALRVQSPPYGLAAQILEDLDPAAMNASMFHLVAAELAVRTGRMEEATRHLKQAISLDPTNDMSRLNLAALQLQSTNEDTVSEALASLEPLSRGTNTGAAALRWRASIEFRRTNYVRAEELSRELQATPGSVFADRLQHLTILKKAGFPGLDAQLSDLKQAAATNAAQVYAACSWMVVNGRPEEALKWLSSIPRKVRDEPPVPFGFVDCYVALRDWRGLEGYLQDQKWDEREFMRQAFLSRIAFEQKQFLTAEKRWSAAVYAAGDRLGPLTTLLGMASSWGQETARENMLWRIASRFPRERWALRELGRLYQDSANTRGLNKLSAALATVEPTNHIHENNFAATSMLLELNLPKAYAIAKTIYDRAPEDPTYACTYAFSLHQQGRSREALGVLERFKTNALLQPSVALYYGMILAANGHADQAANALQVARNSRLLPEEQELLARVKTSSASPGSR